jgi:hypothetical protein
MILNTTVDPHCFMAPCILLRDRPAPPCHSALLRLALHSRSGTFHPIQPPDSA